MEKVFPPLSVNSPKCGEIKVQLTCFYARLGTITTQLNHFYLCIFDATERMFAITNYHQDTYIGDPKDASKKSSNESILKLRKNSVPLRYAVTEITSILSPV